ncbi:hypothetical protein cyc_03650 [Cyclospora cayetanensis]|uniref:Uncharacterized protein n=1 Tax=Cyclospora cayetanensis TaxID=88456 RepID=A0A1D3D4F9_9EIME|nr:hypothetical protein cyc_03650 [Cyclospora cayetanensis]
MRQPDEWKEPTGWAWAARGCRSSARRRCPLDAAAVWPPRSVAAAPEAVGGDAGSLEDYFLRVYCVEGVLEPPDLIGSGFLRA